MTTQDQNARADEAVAKIRAQIAEFRAELARLEAEIEARHGMADAARAHLARLEELLARLEPHTKRLPATSQAGNVSVTESVADMQLVKTKRWGQPLQSRHPLAKALRALDLTVEQWAAERGLKAGTVRQWMSRNSVPTRYAELANATILEAEAAKAERQ